MSTASALQQSRSSGDTIPKKISSRKVSWEGFEKKYLSREDGYKYEWVHGIVEKTDQSMNPTQLYIQKNLIQFFHKLLFAKKVFGELLAEADLKFLSDVHRRPDAAWLTDEQIYRLAKPGVIEVPPFVIEVISKNDTTEKLEKKMDEYRTASVKVAWHIFPNNNTVHVYSGANMTDMKVRKGDDVCSAAPVLPEFKMKVSEIFFKKIITSK